MIPADLRSQPQWILWRKETKPGYPKPAKVPYTVKGHRASTMNPDHCSTYDEAKAAYDAAPERYTGIGFVLGNGIVGIDLDDCIGDDGKLSDFAQTIVRESQTYWEISPSGKGIKLFCLGDLAEGYKRTTADGSRVEAYAGGRYFTVTGKGEDRPLAPLPEMLKVPPKSEKGSTEKPPGYEACVDRVMSMSDSVSGEGGHDALFAACCEIARWGFADELALEIGRKYNEEKCDPAWDEKDLKRKIKEGRKRVTNDGEIGVRLHEGGSLADFDVIEGGDATPTPARSPKSKPEPELPIPLRGQPDFPEDIFPPTLWDYAETRRKAIGCHISLILPALICSAAQQVGRAREVQIKKSWRTKLIFWIAVIGESGTQKTPAWRAGIAPLKRIERRMYAEHDEAYRIWEELKKLHKAGAAEDPGKPPTCDRVLISDCTKERRLYLQSVNPNGLAWAQDELSGAVRSLGEYKGGRGSDKEKLLMTWDGDSDSTDRCNPDQPFVYAENTALNITGGTQPDVWRQLMTSEQNDANGLDARFLVVLPEVCTVQWTDEDVEDDGEEKVADLFKQLSSLSMEVRQGEARPGYMTLSPEARALWIKRYISHRERINALTDKALKSAFTKIEQYTARFAGLIELLWWAENDDLGSDTVIGLQSMKNAIRLADFFIEERLRVTDALGETQSDRDVRELIELISKREGQRIAARDLQSSCRKYKARGMAIQVLERLASDGFCTREVVDTGKRQATVYQLCQGVTDAIKTPETQGHEPHN